MTPTSTTTPDTSSNAPAASAPTTPETAAPAPARGPTFAEIRAARVATAASPPTTSAEPAKTETPFPAGTKPSEPAPAPAGKPVEVDIDEKTLAQFVGLTKALRDTRAKNKELESKSAAADKQAQIDKLLVEGKVIEALALLGPDVLDKATAQALGTKTEPDPLADVKSEVEKLKAAKEADDKRIADEKTAAKAAHDEKVRTQIVTEVTGLPDKFPFLAAKPAAIRDALAQAEKAYEILVKENDGKSLSQAEQDNLLRAAIEEGEHQLKAEYDLLHKAASRGTEPKPATKPEPSTFSADMRGGTAPTPPPAKRMTFEQVRAARAAAGR